MKKIHRITALFLSGLLLAAFAGCGAKEQEQQKPDANLTEYQQTFEDFLDEQFIDALSGSTISLHYHLKNPEEYGLDALPVTLGDLDLEEMSRQDAENKAIYDELLAFDIGQLTQRQQLAYRALARTLDIQVESTDLSIYQNLFSKYGGLQANLPVTLAEYAFYREQDVQDYLKLLEDVPRYFEQAAEFAGKQSEAGLFMPDSGITTAVRQIKDFTSDKETNILIVTFADRLEGVEGLTEQQKAEYITQNKTLVQETVIPAFTSLGKALTELKGTSQNDGGLVNFERGKDYYKMLLRNKTGSDKTPDEMFMMLNRHLTELSRELGEIQQRSPEALAEMDTVVYPEREPQAILTSLEEAIQESFPPLEEIPYHISYVPEALESSLSPAFYMSPPIDDITDNSIYINRASTNNARLYHTLAHEGYPGHLYQTNYFVQTNPHPIMYTTEFTGCKEGWASYVEQLSYDWDPVLADKPDITRLMVLNTRLNMIIGSIVDIGVNYYGWDVKETEEFLSNLGLTANTLAFSLYHLSTTNPGYYPSYCIGNLEMLDLRAHAEDELGELFDEKEFHQVVLETGPCGFTIIGEEVDRYISEKLADAPLEEAA